MLSVLLRFKVLQRRSLDQFQLPERSSDVHPQRVAHSAQRATERQQHCTCFALGMRLGALEAAIWAQGRKGAAFNSRATREPILLLRVTRLGAENVA